MHQRSCSKTFFHSAHQIIGQLIFLLTNRLRLPLWIVRVVDRNERRFTAHRQTNIVSGQSFIDPLAERVDFSPLLFAVWFRDAGVFVNSLNTHSEIKFGFTFLKATGDRGRSRKIRRCSQWNMTFASQQPTRWVKSHPASTRKKDFCPSVQVSEIDLRT